MADDHEKVGWRGWWRGRGAAALLGLAVAIAVVDALGKLTQAGGISRFAAAPWEESGDTPALVRARRYAGLREALAELNVERIGFAALGMEPWPGERYMAQSLLAPVLVADSVDQPLVLVVTELGQEQALEMWLAEAHVRVVRRVGVGMALVARGEGQWPR